MINSISEVVEKVVGQAVLPALKADAPVALTPIFDAVVAGGSLAIEVTATTPNVFRAVSDARRKYGHDLVIGVGTVLDEATAQRAIDAGADLIVTPTLVPAVIETSLRYGVACFVGAFTPTEVSCAMQAGAHMVKVFPAGLGGPTYITHLKRVLTGVRLIPSGGISIDTMASYLDAGAAAVSGARAFVDHTGDLSTVEQNVARVLSIAADAISERS